MPIITNEPMILSIILSLVANAISKQLERAKFKCVLKRLRIQLNFLSNIPITPMSNSWSRD